MYSSEYDACDVTLSVYPHRASLKNMPDHGRNRTWASVPKVVGSIPTVIRHIFQACPVWTLRVTSQASYSPEYITPTQKNHNQTRLGGLII
jgi:hypothetical protein